MLRARESVFGQIPAFLPSAAGHLILRVRCADLLHGHLVLCDCAGFVGADHGCTAECFDCVQPVDQRIPAQHSPDGDRQRDGNGCRQPFRDGCDRNRDAGHQHCENRFPAEDACRENKSADDQANDSNRFAELPKTLLQRRLGLCNIREHLGYFAHLRIFSDCNDFCLGISADDRGPCIEQIRAVHLTARQTVPIRMGMLFRGRGFSGQDGFLSKQLRAAQNQRISGNAVAGLRQNDVIRHEFCCRNRGSRPVSADARSRRCHAAQCEQRLLSAVFLNKAEHRIQNNDHGDRSGIGIRTEHP